jgi:hypothetical protein
VVAQLRRISSSAALVGVHGQALVHALFLRPPPPAARLAPTISTPTSTTTSTAGASATTHGTPSTDSTSTQLNAPMEPTAALLEIVPTPSLTLSGSHSIVAYWRLAVSARVAYFRHAAADAPECKGRYWRDCGNVTVGLSASARPRAAWWSVHDSLIVDLERVARHLTGEAVVPQDEPPTYVAKRNETEYLVQTDMA